MRCALEDAHVTPRDVSVVFASANSTQGLDRVEAQAIADMFGPAAVPVSAVKGGLGECGASAGAAVVAAILSLRSKRVPPTAGFEVADPDCPVNVAATTRAIESANGSVALVNSFARGGANFSLVVKHER